MVAHMNTHRTGEMGKGVYKRGQWITENPVWSTRKKRHKDPKPCRQNPACVEQESRWPQQEAGSSEKGCCPPTQAGTSGVDIPTLQSQWEEEPTGQYIKDTQLLVNRVTFAFRNKTF